MQVTFTIIGAGAVGLAIAAKLSRHFAGDTDVLVVEKERSFGQGISSRNSEVVHSGIYYPTNSLKHLLCVRGRRMLYAYCDTHQVRYQKCGKLIIATEEEEQGALEALYQQAVRNGIEKVTRLDGSEALALEPDISVVSALLSGETGILDSHGFMRALEHEIQANNGTVLYGAAVQSLRHEKGVYYLNISNEDEPITSEYVINSAGLSATVVAQMLGIAVPALFPCKGDYFSYNGRHRCRHLVYPVPHPKLTGLGTHATIDLAGRLKFGPDAEYVRSTTDYAVNPEKKGRFLEAARKIFRNAEYDHLVPDMSGIRPKIQGPDDPEIRDFYIRDEAGSGFPKFINLIGIESPGLTSALAIGQHVYEMVRNR